LDPSVTISFPARADFVRVARLAATGVVSIVDWTVDDVEDFRLVVSEACAHLLDPARHATSLTLRITLHGRDAEVVATADGAASSNGEVLETLAKQVVSALADEVSFESVDGKAAVRFTKSPSQPAPTSADDQG
jgi:hypothetical protein